MSWLLSMAVALTFLPQEVPEKPKKPLSLSLTVDKTDVTIGDEIQVEVTLKNGGKESAELSELVLERRSLSFEIKIPGRKDPFTYSLVRPDPHVRERLPLSQFTLPAGKSANLFMKLPTLKVGEMEIRAVYAGAAAPLMSEATKIKVKKSERGDRLVAIIEIRKPKDSEAKAILVDLLPDEAPANVINFVQLARSGFYDGMIFHRIIKGSWIQSGCPYGLGIGGPGYAIASEAKEQDAKHVAGTLSMSGFEKTGFNGSQFFITLNRIPSLDKKFTVIGQIRDEGNLKTIRSLGKVKVDTSDKPEQEVSLVKLKITVK